MKFLKFFSLLVIVSALLTVAAVLSACATTSTAPQTVTIKETVVLKPNPSIPQDPSMTMNREHYVNTGFNENCTGRPQWTKLQGVRVNGVLTEDGWKQVTDGSWKEGTIRLTYSALIAISINDRIVRYPGWSVTQVLQTKSSSEEVQELNPAPYIERAKQLIGEKPDFQFSLYFTWQPSSVNPSNYFWNYNRSCSVTLPE